MAETQAANQRDESDPRVGPKEKPHLLGRTPHRGDIFFWNQPLLRHVISVLDHVHAFCTSREMNSWTWLSLILDDRESRQSYWTLAQLYELYRICPQVQQMLLLFGLAFHIPSVHYFPLCAALDIISFLLHWFLHDIYIPQSPPWIFVSPLLDQLIFKDHPSVAQLCIHFILDKGMTWECSAWCLVLARKPLLVDARGKIINRGSVSIGHSYPGGGGQRGTPSRVLLSSKSGALLPLT